MTLYDYRIGLAQTLTGTGQVWASLTVLTGTGTSFLTDFVAGDYVIVAGQQRVVDNVVSDTSLNVTVAFATSSAAGQAIQRVRLTNVETLGVLAPRGDMESYSQAIPLQSGLLRGGGWRRASWKWGYLPIAQRDILRAYCPDASALVYIKTKTRAAADAYAVYQATMIWQVPERVEATRRLDFELKFQNLVAFP